MFVCLSMFFFLSSSSGSELMVDVSRAVLSVNNKSLLSLNSPFSVSDGPYSVEYDTCIYIQILHMHTYS